MTIAERKAREAYDRANPWQSTASAKPSGMICEMRTSDFVGTTDFGKSRFFLAEDRHWYRIDPPQQMSNWERLTEFRPTGVSLSPERQRSVIRRAQNDPFERIGGRLYRKPKSYKLYWRADD